MSPIVEICPEALGAVRDDVAATRDAIRNDLGPLRWRMSTLNVPTGALHDVLAVADRLDTEVLPTLDWHVARARDLASLRYGGSMGVVLPVVDVDDPFAPAPDPFTHTPWEDGSTALSWPAAPLEVQDADRQATASSDPIGSWFEDRFDDLGAAVQDGTDWLADTWDQAVDTGARIGDWWEQTSADLGGWIDENLGDVREFIGKHVAVFRFLADACRVVAWVVMAFGVVLTVALAVIGAMGGSALGAVFGLGVGAVPGGGAGAIAGASIGLKILGAGAALYSVGDFLDVAADWGEGTIDGQDLVKEGSLQIALTLGSLVGVGAIGKLLQKTWTHLPESWVTAIDNLLEPRTSVPSTTKDVYSDLSDTKNLRPPVFRPWHGPGGLYLSPDETAAVDHLLLSAARSEPAITAELQTILGRVDGATMPGLEFRLKGDDSLYRKIATDLAEDIDRPRDIASAISKIKDSVRYTAQVPDVAFTDGVESVTRKLTEAGYQPVSWKNSFGQPGYQGINSAWRSPDGQVFELQFHTPESFETKMSGHDLYEEARLPSTTPEEKDRLRAEMARLFGEVPTPPGVQSIKAPEVN